MHMADALLSPAVGGTLWAASAAIIAGCARKLRSEMDDRKVPLMGVLGAFVFAAQMINFAIPGTGSSGHLGGGLLLAVLLGPCAAFLTLASVLTVQALFFADGGLLALGSNIFNLGFFPCFVAYPLVYRLIAGGRPTGVRLTAAALFSAVLALQLGALAVVAETVLSGISSLPFRTFLFLMQPIHLAIGLVEGGVTAAVVAFIWKARPEVLSANPPRPFGKVVATLGLATVLIGGGLSYYASEAPDGLEWAISHASGEQELSAPDGGVHESLAQAQERTALLPDYGFREGEGAGETGTGLAGLVGGGITMALVLGIGWGLRIRRAGRVGSGRGAALR